MLGTAKPFFIIRGKTIMPLSSKSKLVIVFIIFAVSFLSGKVSLFEGASNNKKIRALAEATYDLSPNDAPGFSEEKTQLFQIKQVAIGQEKFVPYIPTHVPVALENMWGVAKKIDTHTYTMLVQSDSRIGTPAEILAALNIYRQRHGKNILEWDDNLANYASTRAEYFSQKGTLDGHAGFLDYLDNQDGFKKLGFVNIGENSSIGFILEAVHLIEWIYAGDAEHNDNQLNNDWRYAGIGVNGSATDLIFAGEKL